MPTVTKTATQARIEFFDLINAAKYNNQETKITKHGRSVAKITADVKPEFDWPAFKKALKACRGIFTEKDVAQIKQARIDSYQNRFPEW